MGIVCRLDQPTDIEKAVHRFPAIKMPKYFAPEGRLLTRGITQSLLKSVFI